MKTYGYAVRHIAAPEHCAGYIELCASREAADARRSFELRYSPRYPSYVVDEITTPAEARRVRDEIRYGRTRLPEIY